MKVKNLYGSFIEEVDGELSEETKEMFPECTVCWDDIELFKEEIFVCGHYGPCNLYPLLKEKQC